MRTILFLVRKEFLQIFRHRVMLPLIFLMPIVQLLILANAADYEIRDISLHVVDRDLSAASRRLVGKFRASPYFQLTSSSFDNGAAYAGLESDAADLFLEIPRHFERELRRAGEARVQLTVNAINGMKAGLANGYANAIIRDFNGEIRAEWTRNPLARRAGFDIRYTYWFNPEMDYQSFMVPGILVILVTLVGMFLSGMNIVKEKEIGTIEQLNVSPIRKHQFIIGKLLPFWIIAMVELSIGLVVGKLAFDIPIEGSLWLIFAFAATYLFVVLGLGLLVSTLTHTQQQAMFLAWFILIIFVLMSGLFTPIESMPTWAERLTLANPIAYFVDVMRLVLLKGATAWDIRHHFFAMLVFALLVNGLAVVNYRKTSG